MRITVVCSVYPPAEAGEAAHAAHLCRQLAAAGQTVTLITSRMPGVDLRDDQFKIVPVMKDWNWGELLRLKKALAESRPDAVLLIYLGPIYRRHPMITYLPTICRRLEPPPIVVTQFENTPGADPLTVEARAGRRIASLVAGGDGIEYRYGTLLRDSDRVVTLCRPHMELLSNWYPALEQKTTVIAAPPLLKVVDDPDGSVRRSTRERLGYGEGDFVVSYFGFIYPQKGVETALEAASLAAGRIPNLKLLMIGGSPRAADQKDPGYADRMRRKADDLGLAGLITWTGHLDDESRVSSCLHASDANIMPFVQGIRLNNSSYAVVSSHGLPVVATRGETIEEEFVDRQNILLFNVGDSEAAATALTELAKDLDLRQRLSEGAQEFSKGRSSWPAVVRQTLEVLSGPRVRT